MSGVVHSSSQSDCLRSAETDSQQVVTSAFYSRALDAVCVTTHEQNILFYHRDGLQQFRQVLLITTVN